MLYNNDSAKLLGLEDVLVKNIYEVHGEQHIDIELPRRIHRCPCCGCETDRIHDYREQKVKDLNTFGKKVLLHLKKRRYVCSNCGKRFYEENTFLPRYYRMTNRAIAHIVEAFRAAVSGAHIAKEHNISNTTAFRYFDLVEYSFRVLPEVLSIDEFKGDTGGEKYQTILADAKGKRVLDILPNRKEADLIAYFRRFQNRQNVKYFVMDMNPHFRAVAKACFPRAAIVIDRYHVTRQVVWAMERVRKAVQKGLSPEWRRHFKRSRYLLSKHPSKLTEEERWKLRTILNYSARLENAYILKNKFLLIMHSQSSSQARAPLSDWIYQAENAGLPEFKECTKAFQNWFPYILNAFDVPYSNGFTEGCNNKTKVLKRVCYGVRNFSRFRNRILHCASCS